MNELSKNRKNNILDFFQIISSEKSQLNYKKAVPFVHISDELVCQWDDLFSEDYEWYKEIWSKSEFDILKTFNSEFNRILNTMEELKDVPDILENDKWKQVMNLASNTLKQLD